MPPIFESINWSNEIIMAFRIALAAVLGMIIGWERETRGFEAGIRTYGAVCLGACTFGIVSAIESALDPTRIAAQVVTGIGFLGAGVILRERNRMKITGLTTAATLWATAAVGLSVAYGKYILGILNTFIIIFLLALGRLKYRQKRSENDDDIDND